MKRLLLVPLLAFIALTGCSKLDIKPGVPECITKKTKDLNKRTPCDEGASVEEYTFQGKIVYTLYTGDCITDGGTEVIDSDCNTIGYLGGYPGSKEVNGVEFSTNATFIRTIWEK